MKKIELTQGVCAIVDDCDYEELRNYKWCAARSNGDKRCRAVRIGRTPSGKRRLVFMHRQILGLTDPRVFTDHVNHNTLDNRRCNIRKCNNAENQCNQLVRQGGTSRFKGVSWSKQHKNWQSNIRRNKKAYYLGGYSDELKAARAYDRAALIMSGAFAHLNFPKE